MYSTLLTDHMEIRVLTMVKARLCTRVMQDVENNNVSKVERISRVKRYYFS